MCASCHVIPILRGVALKFVVVIDACPSDRVEGRDDTWHTLAILQAGSWKDVDALIANLKASLSAKGLQFRKWGGIAMSEKRKSQNGRYRDEFLAALRTCLPTSRVSLFTVSCQERTMIAAEVALCKQLGLEHSVVSADRPSICLGGYTKHWHNGFEVVTLGPFEKVSPDGRSEVISDPLTVRLDNAIVWLWMGHALLVLYRNIEAKHQAKPSWSVHFDRLANDEVLNNYPGLGFIALLLKATTTFDITTTYAETAVNPAEVSTPDLVVDCVAGWVNASVSNGLTESSLEDLLGEQCRNHLDFHIVRDESGFAAMRLG